MKVFFPPSSRLFAAALAVALLADMAPLHAQSSRRHRKPVPAEQDEEADAAVSPAHSRKIKGQKTKTDDQADAAPVPGAKTGAADESADKKTDADAKPTSADEAAPSKAPDSAAAGNPARNAASGAAVSSIDSSEIEGFDAYPDPIRKLLTAALDLTKQNLTYTYGSTDPKNGGMDCSGTMYYLLNQAGFTDVPRQANEQYDWVRRKSRFYAVLSKKQDNFELREMRPGDLLFWTGTYRVDRDPPVTHVMVYLGKRKKDGHRLMFGSSDGRPYDGQRRNGVSVFDFKMPAAKSGDAADAATTAAPDNAPDFSGYGPVPGMTDLADAAIRQTTAAKGSSTEGASAKEAAAGEEAAATPKPKRKSSRSRRE